MKYFDLLFNFIFVFGIHRFCFLVHHRNKEFFKLMTRSHKNGEYKGSFKKEKKIALKENSDFPGNVASTCM